MGLTAGADAKLGSTASHSITITDDDATTVTLGAPAGHISENAGTKTLTVTLGRALVGDETLDVPLTFAGTSDFGEDYTLAEPSAVPTGVSYSNLASTDLVANAPTVSFSGVSSAAASATVILTATADTTDEGASESVTVGIGTITDDLDGGTSKSGTASFNINDDDDAPGGITLTVDKSSIAEDDATATVKVTASVTGGTAYATDTRVQVKVGEDADSAEEGTDYADVAGFELTITAMETSAEKTFSLNPTDDDLDEDAERLSVTGTSGDITVTPASISITDNDDAPTLSIDAPSVAEGDADETARLRFTVSLDAASGRTVTVNYAEQSGGTATANTDYEALTAGTLTFNAGDTEKHIDITVTGDDTDEPNETVQVRLSSAANASLTGNATTLDATGTINDDDATPTATLVLTPATIDESGDDNASTVTATLSGASHQDVTLTVAAAPVDPAVAGDYTLSAGKTLTIAAGSKASTGAVTITAVDNTVDAANKTVTVSATASGGGVADPDDATLTITDDDEAPTGITLTVDKSTIAENAAEASVTVTATVTGGSTYPASKDLTITVGAGTSTAASGDDYTAVETFTLTLPAGAASATDTFDLEPLDDDVDEDTETIAVTGTDAGGVTVAGASIDLTDNDTRGVTVSAATLAVDEADDPDTPAKEHQATYTVVLDSEPTDDVGIDLAATGGAVGLSDARLDFTPSNWNAAQTVTVTAVDDEIDNPGDARSASISHTLVAGDSDYAGVNVSGVTATVNDDDDAPDGIALTVDTDEVAEDAGKTSITVTATVGGGTRYPADATVTVTVGEPTDSAVSGTDYARVSTFDLVITAGEASVSKAFDLTPSDDAFDEADETISVTGESGSLTVTGTSITLTDDDVPELSITAGSAVTEGTAAGFTVNADIAPVADLTVNLDVATTDSFAASGTTGSKTLTFRAGRTSESYTVSTQADTTDEPDGSVAVTLEDGTDYSVDASKTSVSVDVNDDDATTVALARAGSGGIAENGGKEDLTVTLGRALVAGESVTVPLAVSGATVTTHYTLALKGTGGTGVSLDTTTPHNTQNPAVKIEGAGARTATLTLTAVANNDNDSRTVAIAYGTSARAPSSSGLSGGMSTSGSASVPILDDDAMVSVANASAAEGSAVVFTVTLPEVAPSGGVTVGYSTSDGRGNNDDDAHRVATSADYTAAAESAALSIAAGSRSGTISIPTAQDTTYEGDHYFTLNLDSTSHFNLSAAADSAVGTITDAADAPSFAFSTASTDADEDDGTLTLTVEKTGTTLVAATVSYATTNGTATGGSDFTAIASTDLDFAAGDASKDITVSVTDDSADESTEAFTVDLTAGAHAKLGSTRSHSIAITDNDATTVTLQAPSTAIDENAGAKTVTVTLGRALEGDETLDVPLTFSGTATFGDDYTLAAPNSTPTGVSYSNLASTDRSANPPTIAFSGVNGAASSATVILTATSDTTDEGASESVTVGIGTIDDDLDGGTTQSGTGTFNIEDDDDAPGGITLTLDQSTIAEDAATATVTVTASVTGGTAYATNKTVKVKVGESGDSAVEGTDYANVADFDLTINAMETSAEKTFSLNPTDDDLDEDTERLSVTGTSGDITVTGANITITDDDDAPTVSVADAAAVNEGNDPNATVDLSFAVTLDAASGKQVTVPYTLGGTAAATDDYTEPNPLSVTIAAGSRSASIDVPVKGDTLDEPNETVTVTLGAPTNATVSTTEGAGEASGTITDDDATPTATLTLTPAAIDESGAANRSTVTAGLSGATSQDLTLTVAAAPVSPALAGDFTLSGNTTLTIAAGSTDSTGAVTVTAVDNSVDAPDKTVTVSAAASGGNGVASPTDVTLTINDDEGTPTVSVADATAVAEGDDPMTTRDMSFALTLSGTSSQAVTVPYTLAGSATGGSDYETPNPLSATIAAGQRSGTIVVKVKGDTADEVDETIEVSLSTPTNATVSTVQGAGTASGTITDDDATTVLLARAGSGGIAENGGKEDLTITLGRALVAGESVTVPLAVTGATVATHYTLALKGTGGTGVSLLTTTPHSAGSPAVRLSGAGAQTATLTLTAVANTDNASRTVAIAYGTGTKQPTSSGLSGGITTTGAVSVPILDDDAMVSVAAASAAEGSAVVFTITLPENAPSGGVSVGYSTSNGRGNNDDDAHQVATSADYTAAAENAALSIAAGARSGTVSISTTQDTTYEGDHYFTLTLDSTSLFNVSKTAGSATGTITDAADTPTFAFSAASTDADEDDGSLTLTVEKTGTTLVAATVSYATTNGTATGGSDFTAIASTDLDFAAGDASKDITVSLTDDSTDEPAEAFTVDLTAGAHAKLGSTRSHSISITDNDATTVKLAAPSTAIDENAGTKTVTVTLGRALEGDETLDVPLTFSGTATFGTDYTLAAPNSTPTGVTYSNLASTNLATNPPTIAFSGVNGAAASATVILTATSDTTDEGATESVTVGLGALNANSGENLDGGASGSGTATFEITDDDGTPTATLVLTPTSIDESGDDNATTVTATLSAPSSEAVTLTVAAAAVSPATTSDFTLSGTSLTIAAGETTSTGTVTVTAVDNEVDAPDKSVTVSATASGGGVAAPSDVTLTITDDDERGVTVTGGPLTMDEADKVGTAGTREDQGSYTVVLTSKPTDDVRIDISAPSMVTLSPTSLTFTPSNWNQPRTVTATAVDDAVDNTGDARAPAASPTRWWRALRTTPGSRR